MFNFAFDFKWGRGAKKGGAVGAEGRQHATLRHCAKGKERKIILDNSPRELFQALSLVLRILSDQKLPYKDEENIKKHRRFIQSTRDLKQNAINRKLKSQP